MTPGSVIVTTEAGETPLGLGSRHINGSNI